MLSNLSLFIVAVLCHRKMESNQVGKPLKYPNLPEVPVRISNKASLGKVIEDVKNKLTPKEENPSKKQLRHLRRFKRSCFKDLFTSLQRINFSAGIVHHLISRQSKGTDSTCMEFNFGGKAAKFTKQEFGIITGLRMGPLPTEMPNASPSRLLDDYFNNEEKITNAIVREVFIETKEFMEDDDILKLALLYFLECGILGKESKALIDIEHLAMVEDLDYFNSYPWGELSYSGTIQSMHKALGRKGGLNKSGTYSLFGCPLALQVWYFIN